MSILRLPPGVSFSDWKEFTKDNFQLPPDLREMVEEKERRESFLAEQSKKPLELGFIKQRSVRVWAMAYVAPPKTRLSRTQKEPYFCGFWVEEGSLNSALKAAAKQLNDFPAGLSLHIANFPTDPPLAGGFAPDRDRLMVVRCPKQVKVPKTDPPRSVKLGVTGVAGVGLMVLLSLSWPPEFSRFSWVLAVFAVALFIVWKNFGDSAIVGRALNFFRPSRRVNVLKDYCPSVEDFKPSA